MSELKKEDFIDHKYRDEKWQNLVSEIIDYLEGTTDDQWCVDVVKNRDNGNCLFGHVFDFFSKKWGEEKASQGWEWFESAVSTTFYVYPINDGKNPDYPQSTPKERCIALMKNILSGDQLTTMEGIDYAMAEYRANGESKG